MRRFIALIAAVSVPSTLHGQDLASATPVAGEWRYAAALDGSEATFSTAGGVAQLWLHCTRATRRIAIARSAAIAAPFLSVWSSSAKRDLPSGYTPATGRLTANIGAYDPLFDALSNSRGRIAVGIPAQPTLVVPAWPEIARVVEDCRA